MAGQQALPAPARSWVHRPGRRQEFVSFKHGAGRRQPARPPLPLCAASAATAGEEGKLLQSAIRNISAFAAPGLRRPTRPFPLPLGQRRCCPPSPRLLLPCAHRYWELLEKQQPVSHRAAGSPGPEGVAMAMHPRCSMQSKNWVTLLGAGGRCGCLTHAWVP